jgi:hypothetical protein
MTSSTLRRAVRKVVGAAVASGIFALAIGVDAAGAASSSTLQYSTDGGTTWSSSASVAPGDAVLVRQWFDNDGDVAEADASITTSLPSGFSLVGGSTQVCLNPSTTSVASPDASELLCAAADEGAVWAGSDLQVSPSAGHYGEDDGATVGELAFGRKRYLNLQSCAYRTATTWFNAIIPAPAGGAQFDGLTEVSNTAATALACGPAGAADTYTYTLATASSGYEVLPLLGRQHLNLHQCSYLYLSQDWYSNWTTNTSGGAAYDAGTNTSSTADAALSCGGVTSGYAYQASASGLQALELDERYLNLHQCTYWDVPDSTWYTSINPTPFGGATFDAGTNVSATPDTSPTCGPPGTSYTFDSTTSAALALDLLDTDRAGGYVEYEVTAPTTPTASACAAGLPITEQVTQDGALTSDPSGLRTTSGTIDIDWSGEAAFCEALGIPMVDGRVLAAGAVALAAVGAGCVAHRRRSVVTR